MESPELHDYPALLDAVQRGRPLPLALSGDEVKSPAILSFPWVISELKTLGVIN